MELHEELSALKVENNTYKNLLKQSNAARVALDEMYTTNIRQLHEEKSKNALLKDEVEELKKNNQLLQDNNGCNKPESCVDL